MSPGRIRLKFSPAAFDSPDFQEAEKKLAGQPGIRNSRVNRAAESLVVEYNPEAVHLSTLLGFTHQAGITVHLPEGRSGAGAGPMAPVQAVNDAIARANRGVAQAAGGLADLRFLVPVGLSAWAVREIFFGRGLVTVPWYALAWYAFDTFSRYNKTSQPSASQE